MNERKSLGTQGALGLKNSIGIAYIAIPKDEDRTDFIKTCLRTQTVMLRDESGGTWRNIFISAEALFNVEFPELPEERGTAVVFGKVPKHNLPVVLNTLVSKSILGILTEEKQFRLQKKHGGNSVDFVGRAQSASVDLSIASVENGIGALRVNITNPDKTALLDVYVKGTSKVFSDKKIELGTNEEFLVSVTKPDQSPLAKIYYKAGEGLIIEDEFKNTIILSSGSVKIKEGSDTGKTIHLAESKINLGSDSASEPVPLGDKLKGLLERLIDAINQITVPTPVGPSGFPVNAPVFIQIKAELATMLSTVTKTD